MSVGPHVHADGIRNAFEKIEIERTAAHKKRCAVVRLIHAVAARRFRAVEGDRRRLVGRKLQRAAAAAARREHKLPAVTVDLAEIDRPAAREIKSPNKTIYLAARGKRALRTENDLGLLRDGRIQPAVKREAGIRQIEMRPRRQIGLSVGERKVIALKVNIDRPRPRHGITKSKGSAVQEMDFGIVVDKRHRTVSERIFAGQIE